MSAKQSSAQTAAGHGFSWQMVSCHLFSSCLDVAVCQRHHDIIIVCCEASPVWPLRHLASCCWWHILQEYFEERVWKQEIWACVTCPSFAHFYGKWQMCSSTLTVSLLLVANLNFGFIKLYRVTKKPCQFCNNVTLFCLYSTDIKESLLNLAFNWSSRWCQPADFKISERIFMQLVESCFKNILSLDVCGCGNSESKRGYQT